MMDATYARKILCRVIINFYCSVAVIGDNNDIRGHSVLLLISNGFHKGSCHLKLPPYVEGQNISNMKARVGRS